MATNEKDPVLVRADYVSRWNEMMVTIWKEKIRKLEVVDTMALYNSVIALPVQADGRFTEMSVCHQFNLYGVYQDRGTGSNTPKGNGGALVSGRNARKPKPWMSRKYVASMYNIRDFMAESIGQEFVGIVMDGLSVVDGVAHSRYRGYSHV